LIGTFTPINAELQPTGQRESYFFCLVMGDLNNKFSSGYDMWIRQIAGRAVSSNACLQVTGHTSATGPAALDDRLSLLRAEYIQSRLESEQAPLKKRIVAAGVGSRENLIGTGKDDASDALDRRVELKPIEPCA
jgi:outer membrane protein OmpA-like peptidoglycan-associated protein